MPALDLSACAFALAATLLVAGVMMASAEPETPAFAAGADVSFLKQAEEGSTVFREAGVAKPGLQILKDHGYNWVRLRLFHTPTDLPNSLPYTIAAAQDARRLGFRFLLDIHYSDTWADPGKQFIPRAWEAVPAAVAVL